MISRLLKIRGLSCRIQSLLQGSFAKETYTFKEPTNRSHPIPYHVCIVRVFYCIESIVCIFSHPTHLCGVQHTLYNPLHRCVQAVTLLFVLCCIVLCVYSHTLHTCVASTALYATPRTEVCRESHHPLRATAQYRMCNLTTSHTLSHPAHLCGCHHAVCDRLVCRVDGCRAVECAMRGLH